MDTIYNILSTEIKDPLNIIIKYVNYDDRLALAQVNKMFANLLIKFINPYYVNAVLNSDSFSFIRGTNSKCINILLKPAIKSGSPILRNIFINKFVYKKKNWDLGAMISCDINDIKMLQNITNLGTIDAKKLLIKACETGNFDIVKYVVEHNLNFAMGSSVFAKASKFTNIFEYLMSKVDIKSIVWGGPVLKFAATHGNKITIDYCISLSDSVNMRIDWNEALKNICMHGHEFLVTYLINKCREPIKWDLLLKMACRSGNINIVAIIEAFIQNLIPPTIINWDNNLWNACAGGNMMIINKVIQNGGNSWEKGLLGSIYSKNIQIYENIWDRLDYNAKTNITFLNLVLINAAGSNFIKVIKKMIQHPISRKLNWVKAKDIAKINASVDAYFMCAKAHKKL